MGKKIVRYQQENSFRWGLVEGNLVTPISGDKYQTLAQLLEAEQEAVTSNNTEAQKPLSQLQLLSPVTEDAKLICQGLNYAEHQEESGHQHSSDEEFLHFAKDSSSLSGAYDPIIRPDDCKLLDYEAELGLVLKKAIDQATEIDSENLKDYVAGMVICNDVSARDIMFGASFFQWFKGKSQRSFCPTGPFFYWLDEGEVDCIFDLDVKLTVNGETRQEASTTQLIHRPEKVLSELSQQINLKAGDLLLTGTPGGVSAQNTPRSFKAFTTLLLDDVKRRSEFTEDQLEHGRFLEPGDEVRITITSPDGDVDLGEQINIIENTTH